MAKQVDFLPVFGRCHKAKGCFYFFLLFNNHKTHKYLSQGFQFMEVACCDFFFFLSGNNTCVTTKFLSPVALRLYYDTIHTSHNLGNIYITMSTIVQALCYFLVFQKSLLEISCPSTTDKFSLLSLHKVVLTFWGQVGACLLSVLASRGWYSLLSSRYKVV